MILDEDFYEEEEIQLTDQEIFTQIWTSPRRIFRHLQDKKYDKYVVLLLILAGIANSLNQASGRNYGEEMSLWAILGMSILKGALFGWISYYIFAALLRWTGSWMDGKSTTQDLLRVLAYAAIPSIVTLFLWIPQLSIFGNEIFQRNISLDQHGLFSTITYYAIIGAEVVLGFWSLWLMVTGISEIQKFTNGKALGNLFLAGLVIVIPLLIIVFFMSSFS